MLDLLEALGLIHGDRSPAALRLRRAAQPGAVNEGLPGEEQRGAVTRPLLRHVRTWPERPASGRVWRQAPGVEQVALLRLLAEVQP
eukprot:3075191-Lingulodinium_polyedra.AAC.1